MEKKENVKLIDLVNSFSKEVIDKVYYNEMVDFEDMVDDVFIAVVNNITKG
jgi:hypothetical protein